MIVKGGDFRFTPNRLRQVLMNEFSEVGQIAARRMEQDAKQFLSERIGVGIRGPVSKSTGTLEAGIQGYFTTTNNAVYAGVTASALELGQWEASVGEPDEAAATQQTKPFDYAGAVEGGTGIYGPTRQPIRPATGKRLRFWTGDYREQPGGFRRVIHSTRSVRGQKPKNFLGDAILTAVPGLVDLIGKVGKNIRINDVIRWN